MTLLARSFLPRALTLGAVLLLPALAAAQAQIPALYRPVPNTSGLEYLWLQRAYYRYYEVANSAAHPQPPSGTRYVVTERHYVTGIGPDLNARTFLVETVTAVPARAPVPRTVHFGSNR
jgi:hypothetical protein